MTAQPTFVIAGVQKCGTTSLFQALDLHPRVQRPRHKEIHFFDQHWRRGTDWYADQFPDLTTGQITGEATPVYSYGPTARRRMIRTLPDVKVVLVLRDPVSRAYSHYWHSRRNQETLPTFEEALAAEPDRLASGSPLDARRFSYFDRGRYIAQVRPLQRAYGANLLVTTLEQLTADPTTEIAAVMRHVGLDPTEAPELTLPEVNRYRALSRQEERALQRRTPARTLRRLIGRDYVVRDRERPPMAEATRTELRRRYETADRRLLAALDWPRLPWHSLANPAAVDLTDTGRLGRQAGDPARLPG